jgi:hypothetical protein
MRLIGMVALACLLIAPAAMAGDAGSAMEDLTAAVGYETYPTAPIWGGATAVLWDNGPLVTHPGGGAGGADASALQTALGMGTYGYGHQILNGYVIADDFTVPPGDGWSVESITFFAYQTSAGTGCTMTQVYYTIYDGEPGLGGAPIYGDYATNRLNPGCAWTNIYRTLDTDLFSSARAVMADEAAAAVSLDPGTYWVGWQTDGSGTSGPWAPPVTVLGSTGTGNGLQSLDLGASWAPVIDVGGQDFPFIIQGSGGTTATEATTWGGVKTIYR